MGQTNGQTDGRTPDSFIDPAPHTMWAVSVTYTDSHPSADTR